MTARGAVFLALATQGRLGCGAQPEFVASARAAVMAARGWGYDIRTMHGLGYCMAARERRRFARDPRVLAALARAAS